MNIARAIGMSRCWAERSGRPVPDKRFQVLAATIVAKAKRKGTLPPISANTTCADCAARAVEYDHRDYGRPLEVDPVCRRCNVLRGCADAPTAGTFCWLSDKPQTIHCTSPPR